MFFKSYNFTWWQIGIFKLALLAVGIAIGAHWYRFFEAYLAALIIIAVIASLYIMFACLKQLKETSKSSLMVPEVSREMPTPSDKTMNINIASAKELDKLWGVGNVLAQSIINYRDAHGGFKTPEEIKLIEGIDEKKWNQWKFQGWIIKVN